MSAIEHLADADYAAVGCLLLEAYADYAERMGSEWPRLRDGLSQAANRLANAEIAGVRGTDRPAYQRGHDDCARPL